MIHTHAVKKVGSVLSIDSDGFIQKRASIDLLQKKWKEAVDFLIQAYCDHFGDYLHSVYIRGSVATGNAIDGISDIDAVALVTCPKEKIDQGWINDFDNTLQSRFPFVNGVEYVIKQQDSLTFTNRFMLKTQSVCVFGKDITEEISPFTIDERIMQHLPTLARDGARVKEMLAGALEKAEIRHWCRWIMKRILRAGFELVMVKEQVYTRDLYPCYEYFVRAYPGKQKEMYAVLHLAINPSADRQTIIDLIDSVGAFVVVQRDQK